MLKQVDIICKWHFQQVFCKNFYVILLLQILVCHIKILQAHCFPLLQGIKILHLFGMPGRQAPPAVSPQYPFVCANILLQCWLCPHFRIQQNSLHIQLLYRHSSQQDKRIYHLLPLWQIPPWATVRKILLFQSQPHFLRPFLPFSG